MVVLRGEVWLIRLDPTLGREIGKTRPGVIVSPDEANMYLQTVMVAPLTSAGKAYPTRVACRFEGRDGPIAIDQLRTVDKERLVKRLGVLEEGTAEALFDTIVAYFQW